MLTLGVKFAFNKLKILGGNLTSLLSKEFISLKDFVKSLSVFNKNITNLEKKSTNDSSQISYWGSILNFFRDLFTKNEEHDLLTPMSSPDPSMQPYQFNDYTLFSNTGKIGGYFLLFNRILGRSF